MTFINVLVLVAVLVPIALLALAPSVPARRNPFPGRRPDRTRRRPTATRPSEMPHQQTNRHHAR
ncbi:hypothetical protein [Streptomyces sp. ITFR-16]|uniref:hypothetical protein n=1 Tax=Streptomyces sp. ITFR-16 TaxID=3075198 RepID=UPI00288C1F41|nr:hypothetical protein [Streptomyces sp. ITFR-16]WNI26715.1 hypothetical protein RLT58_34705 [Streptomyces sp. ITFR-16]